jgi:thiamine biosynthesis lipoprotein
MERRTAALLTVMAVLVLASLAFWRTHQDVSSLIVLQSNPQGVMGTVCSLVVVTNRNGASRAQEGLDTAEAELRRQEALLSTWMDSSSISRFNAAPANQSLVPAEEVLTILMMARDLHSATSGAFDITARPLIELWRMAGNRDVLPSEEELERARGDSKWDQIQISANEVVKARATTRVDVDGIAKGHAIDRAVEVMQRSGAAGGLVEVGGDLRLFGQAPKGESWTVAIRSPFEDVTWAEIEIRQGAVCSSGDYARPVQIQGHRFSHIIDPRNGWPAEATHAVTVIGPDAATADAWATALSILGSEGLDRLERQEGYEGMVVSGDPEDYRVRATTGFEPLLVRAAFVLSD